MGSGSCVTAHIAFLVTGHTVAMVDRPLLSTGITGGIAGVVISVNRRTASLLSAKVTAYIAF